MSETNIKRVQSCTTVFDDSIEHATNECVMHCKKEDGTKLSYKPLTNEPGLYFLLLHCLYYQTVNIASRIEQTQIGIRKQIEVFLCFSS